MKLDNQFGCRFISARKNYFIDEGVRRFTIGISQRVQRFIFKCAVAVNGKVTMETMDDGARRGRVDKVPLSETMTFEPSGTIPSLATRLPLIDGSPVITC